MSKFSRTFRDIQAGSRNFYVVDAKDAIVGRLASKISPILQGKHKPVYDMQKHDAGDYVIVVSRCFFLLLRGIDGWEYYSRRKGGGFVPPLMFLSSALQSSVDDSFSFWLLM